MVIIYPDVRSSTLHKGCIIEERNVEFKERVKEQFYEIRNEDKVIWNITHSLVLLHVARLSNIERDPHVDYLDMCVIHE